jgi:archaellum component FlaF (FlaF/FlaG flagellin family)
LDFTGRTISAIIGLIFGIKRTTTVHTSIRLIIEEAELCVNVDISIPSRTIDSKNSRVIANIERNGSMILVDKNETLPDVFNITKDRSTDIINGIRRIM